MFRKISFKISDNSCNATWVTEQKKGSFYGEEKKEKEQNNRKKVTGVEEDHSKAENDVKKS